MKLFPLVADMWKMDGGIAFGVVPRVIWNKIWPADEHNMIDIVDRCLLITSGDRRILVDTGMGRKREEKYYRYRFVKASPTLEESLEQAGYSPSGITDIILTHLHDDHVGGATMLTPGERVVPVFENAAYWCSEAQWKWAMEPNKREGASFFRDNLIPLLETRRLNLLTEEGDLFPGISVRFFNGHTIGQMIPFITVKDKTVVYMADFIPALSHLHIPYIAAVDIQPLKAMDEKTTFLREAADRDYILFFEHDDRHECCTVKASEKGIVADKVSSLAQLLE